MDSGFHITITVLMSGPIWVLTLQRTCTWYILHTWKGHWKSDKSDNFAEKQWPVYHKQSSNSLVYYHASFKPFWSVKSRRSVKQYGLKDWQSTLELTSKMGLYKILLCNPQARCNVNKTAIKGITSFNAWETFKKYLFWEKKEAVSFHW